MERKEAIKTIKEAESCFCRWGAYKDCHSQCDFRDALDVVISTVENAIHQEEHEKWLRDDTDDPNAGKYYGDI